MNVSRTILFKGGYSVYDVCELNRLEIDYTYLISQQQQQFFYIYLFKAACILSLYGYVKYCSFFIGKNR
jgi:hypothetical protein